MLIRIPGVKRLLLCGLAPIAISGIAAAGSAGDPKEVNWPSFRGADARGIAEGFAAPTTWNVEEKKGVRWKTAIPGLGHSSPIVWGDRVFVTGAISGSGKQDVKTGLYGNIDSVPDESEHQ